MQWLLVPTGVSQLLTQVAAMRVAGVMPETSVVRSACYHWGPAMREALSDACDAFQLTYLGNTSPINFSPSTELEFGAYGALLARFLPKRFHRYALRKLGWRVPRNLGGLVVCVRPNVYDELFYYSVQRPRELICTIDGVNPRPPRRELAGRFSKQFDAPFVNLPMSQDVYAPEYLLMDAKQLGHSVSIPGAVERSVFARYRQGAMATEFQALLRQLTQSTDSLAIVFSQQLSQSLYLDEQDEHAYYMDMVAALKSRGVRAIVFKQHPRDPSTKLSKLRRAFGSDPSVLVVPDRLACVSIEPFLEGLAGVQLLGASTNSSALLSFRAITGGNILSFDSSAFSTKFQNERLAFCERHNIPSQRLDRTSRRVA